MPCDLDAAKLQPLAAEGGASSHSRLQRCMRRGRSLQQRMQLHQLQQQESEAGRQRPEQQQQEEELQARYRPIKRYVVFVANVVSADCVSSAAEVGPWLVEVMT